MVDSVAQGSKDKIEKGVFSMQDKGLQVFSFESNNVRVVMKGSEPWFVAKDVCGVLEIQNARDTIAKVLDDDEKGVDKIDTLGGAQEMNIINEWKEAP